MRTVLDAACGTGVDSVMLLEEVLINLHCLYMCCVCAGASVLFLNCNLFQQFRQTKAYKHVSDLISRLRMAKCVLHEPYPKL